MNNLDNVYEINPKRTRKEIALQKYKEGKFSDPILQLYICDLIIKNQNIWEKTERLIILHIWEQTISKNIDRIALGAGDLSYAIDCNRRTAQRLRDKLSDEGWIDVRESSCRHRIKLNLEKIMALGDKGAKSSKSRRSEAASGGLKPPLDKKSYIIKDNISEYDAVSVILTGDKILDKLKLKRSRLMRTTGSLAQTWIQAWNDSEFRHKMKIKKLKKESFLRLSRIFGENGRWSGSTEDAHIIVYWSVIYWLYCYHRFQNKNMPKIPQVGWFVASFDKFLEIWLDNIPDDESDENVILLKEKAHIREMKDKYRQILKDKE